MPGSSTGQYHRAGTLMAITCGSIARCVAVQGAPLRSARATCTRLARIAGGPGQMTWSVNARP